MGSWDYVVPYDEEAASWLDSQRLPRPAVVKTCMPSPAAVDEACDALLLAHGDIPLMVDRYADDRATTFTVRGATFWKLTLIRDLARVCGPLWVYPSTGTCAVVVDADIDPDFVATVLDAADGREDEWDHVHAVLYGSDPPVSPKDLQTFEADLRLALCRELKDQLPTYQDQVMRAFDLGCFPWFGYIELSFLTAEEPVEYIDNPGDWRLYGFNVPHSSAVWPHGQRLIDWLQEHHSSPKPPYRTNEALWEACARAVMSPAVQSALAQYERSGDFNCRVFNPYDPAGKNFCSYVSR